MKKLRMNDAGKKKQHEIDNLSKQKIRETPKGNIKHQEESKEAMKKLRITDTRKKKQHEIDNLSKQKIREPPNGKEKQKEIDNVSKKSAWKYAIWQRGCISRSQGNEQDWSILDTNAYKIIEKDFLVEINEGPEYKCEICICWNYKKSVSILNSEKYDAVAFEKSYIIKSDISDDKQL